MTSVKALALLGPTASGKTSLGITLARAFLGEIINLDSVQVYKEMDIGSAKPALSERMAVKHHLLDIASPNESLNTFKLFELALKAGQEVLDRGKLPIFTGGTGLYFKALFYGMFAGPNADWDFRHAFRERMAREGLDSLYAELTSVDPLSAARIAPQDALRIERALEVFHLTGKTKSDLEKEQIYHCPFDFIKVGISYPRAELYERINTRVDQMLEQGLVAEVKDLENRYPEADILRNAIGYKEVLSYLNSQCTYPEMAETLKRHSRRFAKRQLTLFRALPGVEWFCPPQWEPIKNYIENKLRD